MESSKADDKKEEQKEDKNVPAAADANAQEVKDLLAKTEISLLLDNYDDIFSDFDP